LLELALGAEFMISIIAGLLPFAMLLSLQVDEPTGGMKKVPPLDQGSSFLNSTIFF